MKRFDLSDKEFALIKDVAAHKPVRGPEPKQIREMLDAILFVLCAGIPWRCLPKGYRTKPLASRFSTYKIVMSLPIEIGGIHENQGYSPQAA